MIDIRVDTQLMGFLYPILSTAQETDETVNQLTNYLTNQFSFN
jgi:hypothetical protein